MALENTPFNLVKRLLNPGRDSSHELLPGSQQETPQPASSEVLERLTQVESPNEKIDISKNGPFTEIVVTSTNKCKVTERPYHNEGFRKALIVLIQEQLQQGNQVLYVYIDMRRLKNINDRFSHSTGNQALQFEHRDQSGGDEWGGVIAGNAQLIQTAISNLREIGTGFEFNFTHNGVDYTEQLSAEYGFVLLDSTDITEQINKLKYATDPSSQVDNREYSLDKFADAATLYDLALKACELQIKLAKENQRFNELVQSEVIFKNVYRSLLGSGELKSLNAPGVNQNETLYSYLGSVKFLSAFDRVLAKQMARRLDETDAFYYLNLHKLAVDISNKLGTDPSQLTDTELQLLGLTPELSPSNDSMVIEN